MSSWLVFLTMKSTLNKFLGVLALAFALTSCGEATPSQHRRKENQTVFNLPKGEKVVNITEDDNYRGLLTYSPKDSLYHYRTISQYTGITDMLEIKETR